jgi:hypothetical protein
VVLLAALLRRYTEGDEAGFRVSCCIMVMMHMSSCALLLRVTLLAALLLY